MTHWCQNIPRDEAVRAAEDNRQGPLPTLEEAIAGVTERRPVDAGGGGNVTALRTERDKLRAERITQALTADRFASAVAEADTLRTRVAELEASAPAASGAAGSFWMVRWPEGGDHDIDDELFADEQTARDMAEMEDGAVVVELVERQAASGAAGTEAVAWGYAHPNGTLAFASVQEPEPGTPAIVPLYAAPQAAKGWLTAEERETLMRISYSLDYVQFATSAHFIRSLLARSTPPGPEAK